MLLTEYDEKKHRKTVREEGREEGFAAGRMEEKIAIVLKLLQSNRYTINEIAELTELTEGEIEALLEGQ